MTQSARKILFRIGGLAIIAAVLAFGCWAVYAVIKAFFTVVLEVR